MLKNISFWKWKTTISIYLYCW